MFYDIIGRSSNGRTEAFEAFNLGSIPSLPASLSKVICSALPSVGGKTRRCRTPAKKFYHILMKEITLKKQWVVNAPLDSVFKIMTDFENLPKYFPKVAESVEINKHEGNKLEMEATVKSFGKKFKVKMKTQILPGKGFISDNDSYQFGTSGHEELILSPHSEGTLVDYTYQVSIHKKWLRVIATPLLRWYSMRYWEKAVIFELRKILEKNTKYNSN